MWLCNAFTPLDVPFIPPNLHPKYGIYLCVKYFAKLSTNLFRNINAIEQSLIEMLGGLLIETFAK